MVFEYFTFARAKKNQEELEKKNPQNPVLKEEDELFLERVATTDGPVAPLPPGLAKDDGTVLSAQTPELKEAGEAAGSVELPKPSKEEEVTLNNAPQKRTWGAYVPSIPTLPNIPSIPNISTLPSIPSLPTWKGKAVNKTPATHSDSAAEKDKDAPAVQDTTSDSSTDKVDKKDESDLPPGVKITENVKLDEAKREEDTKEVSVLLDRLNLSSINNRVFSFSDKSQKLYEEFTIILKDVINGGPTAYQDMESLLKNNDAHLKEMFSNMPPFVQTLVKSLPAKLGGSFGPEILAAASAKPGADLKTRMAASSEESTTESSSSTKKKRSIPTVKGLVNQQGAVAGMLKTIVTFLKTRFPVFITGTNVIMSLSVFILLFVFWYCHKRGKETRLLKEKEAGSAEDANDASETDSGMDESQELTPATTEDPELKDGELEKLHDAEPKQAGDEGQDEVAIDDKEKSAAATDGSVQTEHDNAKKSAEPLASKADQEELHGAK